jgi:anti-sigma regulatory factor (Ser/Thr protein kinase)
MEAVLPPTPSAPAAARRAVEPVARALSAQASNQLQVVVTELVSNAVLHSNDGPIGLSVELEDEVARVEVRDHGVGFEAPQDPHSRFPETGGFGLVLVDRLARRWGVRHDDGATVVWSELPR